MALVGYKKVPSGYCIYAKNVVILHMKINNINNIYKINIYKV